MTYLITFACYGSHIHGTSEGSVDRNHRIPGSRLAAADPSRMAAERFQMHQPPYYLGENGREVVLASIIERCSHHNWRLIAAHVRTNHVHVVVDAGPPPERVMNDLKSYASRRLNQLGLDQPGRKRWARHGSTRWLWNRAIILAAIRYVVDQQGDALAVYESPQLFNECRQPQ